MVAMAKQQQGRIEFGRMMGRELPRSDEAEAALLGSMMLDHKVIDDVLNLTTADDFFNGRNAAIFQHMAALHHTAGKVDIVLLKDSLHDAGKLESVGGVDYLIDVTQAVPSATSAEYYAGIVRDKARQRRLIDACGKIIWRAYHEATTADEQQTAAEAEIFALSEAAGNARIVQLNEAMRKAVAQVEARAEGKADDVLAIGYPDIDDHLHALRPGSLVVMAGETAMGKSAFCLNVAVNVAKAGNPVLYFTLEMEDAELAERVVSAESGVTGWSLHHPEKMHADEWQAIAKAEQRHGDTPLYLADTPGLSLAQCSAISRRAIHRSGVKLVCIDYLQIMEYPDANNEVASIRQITSELKRLARQLHVAIVLVSQLRRRGTSESDDRPPALKDLHGSSSIEKDANAVLFVHRPAYYHRFDAAWKAANPDEVDKAYILVAKQRNGENVNAALLWDGDRMQFKSLATEGAYQ